MGRDELLLELGKTGKKRFDAARGLLADALGGSDTSSQVLFSHVGVTDEQPPRLAVTLGKSEQLAVGHLMLAEIQANAGSRDALCTLALQCALSDVIDHALDDALARDRRPLPDASEIEQVHASAIATERVSNVLRRLNDHTSVRLIGQSASGKTVTAAQIASSLLANNWTVSWLDLSDPCRDAFDLLASLVRSSVGLRGRHLVVIDDAQANPGEIKRIAKIVDRIALATGCPLTFLVLGWESAAAIIGESFPETVSVTCHGDTLIPQLGGELVAGISDEQLAAVRQSSAGDLLVARLMLENLQETGRLPTTTETASLAFDHATNGEQLGADEQSMLFRLCSLSQLEIDIAVSYAKSFSKQALARLVGIGCVRRNGEYLSIGHRSLARMLLFHLSTANPSLPKQLPSSGSIAVDYIRGAAPQQIVSTLERLDVAGLAYGPSDQHGTTFLAKAWESLIILINYLAKQARSDSTWGDNTASSVFAAEALAEIGHDAWKDIAGYLHGRWQISDDQQLIAPVGEPPSERIDFDEIQKTMADVEALVDEYAGEDLAANIDYDRMHRTWALGLILGFEGSARTPRAEELSRLKSIADAIQLPDGSFYPSRVPWVAARVLIGLAKAGESIRSNETVKRGCNWLRRAFPEGPYRFGTWESGTGTWNTTLGTTSMCVNALVRCGVPTTDPCVSAGTAYLLSKRDEWVRPGQEIDGAFAMETVLATRGRWREISNELAALLSWVRDREAWTQATQLASESHDESCKVSQIASSLVGIVWDTVKAELPLLLEGIATTIYEPPKGDGKV